MATGVRRLSRFFKTLLFLSIFLLLSLVVLTYQSALQAAYSNNVPTFDSLSWSSKSTPRQSCAPSDYAAGQWRPNSRSGSLSTRNMTQPHDAIEFSGFAGCASPCDFCNWRQLAADNEQQYDRFPRAQSHEWIPGERCSSLRPFNAEELVKDLVEDGGWYIVGDSVSENHFFSLSCLLFPHVVATPNFTLEEHWERDYPQHLYLSPTSPLIQSIKFPIKFDIAKTPLVSFKRIDVLFSKDELIQLHRLIQPPNLSVDMAQNTLFSEEGIWTTAVDEYFTQFVDPEANYATMVVSTGAHWTVTLFSQALPKGIEGVLNLFDHAMQVWLEKAEMYLAADQSTSSWMLGPFAEKIKSKRRVVVRAYPPGHEDCHQTRAPFKEVKPFVGRPWNWDDLGKFNNLFENLLEDRRRYPNVHFLGIDRPARLRPDAHITGDCLHIMTGAGVLEGWTHYIWHYITREL